MLLAFILKIFVQVAYTVKYIIRIFLFQSISIIRLLPAEKQTTPISWKSFISWVSDTKHTVVNLSLSIAILSLYHKEVFQMSTKFTDDEWLLIFQQRTQSGLSVRKWCDSNQISYDKYKYWEKKLMHRTELERTVSPMDFVELPQALLPSLPLEQEQAYPFELSFHGSQLKIASHAQLSQLAGILKILQASC